MLHVLKNFNFTIMLIGRVLSNMGSSFYAIAAMWLVYDLGGSTFYTGLALFLTSIPTLFQVVLGPVIDRFVLKRLLVMTQFIQAILLLVIPLGYVFNVLSIALILTVMPFISLLNQFLYPAQLSALPKILKKEDLTHGNSLFSIAFQGSDAAFSALAGLLLTVIGATAMFWINSATFLLSAMVLLALRLPFLKAKDENETKQATAKELVRSYVADLKEGFHVLRLPIFVNMLLGIVFVNLATVGIYAVLPAFSEIHGGATYYGLFMAASAVGVLVGSFCVSAFQLSRFKVGRLYAILLVTCGLCWMVMGLIPNVWIAILLFACGWIPSGMLNVISFTMIQSAVPAHLVGRVTAAVIGLSAGISPLGALFGGAMGEFMGVQTLIIISGLLIMAVSVYWFINNLIRNLPAVEKMTPHTLGISAESNVDA